jgi:hypothetical protein
VLLGLVVVLVGVAGCAGSDEQSDTATIASDLSAASSSTNAEPLPTSAPTTEPPPTPTTPDVAFTTVPSVTTTPVGDDGACLVGDWVVTEDEMDAYYAALMSAFEAPLTLDTVGSAPLSFAADGTYMWSPAFSLLVEVAGQSGTGDVGGTITGDWAAVDGAVTTSSDLNAVTVSIEVNGVGFDGDDLVGGFLNASPVNGVTYSCDGPTPVLDFQTSDPSVTVPVTLTRA